MKEWLRQRLDSLRPRLSEWRTMKSVKAVISLLVIMPLVFLSGRACGPAPEWQQMGVTNFDSVHLSDTSATATPILRVNQVGTGKIAEFLDNDTAAFSINDGGTISLTGALDLNGSELIMDADGDTTMIASSDDIITVTVNLTTGYTVIGVGNLKVGNSSPTTAQDGEDAYVEGGFEVDGTARFDGAIDANSTMDIAGNISSASGPITITDNVLVDGAADAEQLVAQGYTTQTNSIFIVENSAGTDIFEVTTSGADLNNNPLINVGAAGTDFGTDGSLTTAQMITVTAGGANVTGSIDGSADVDIGTWLNLSAQSTIALGADGTITPTGTYQVITSTAEVTTSTSVAVSNGGETGDLLILRNGNAADVINIDGTGANVECKANVALGVSDTLTLIWNGSDWNCIANYDNS